MKEDDLRVVYIITHGRGSLKGDRAHTVSSCPHPIGLSFPSLYQLGQHSRTQG